MYKNNCCGNNEPIISNNMIIELVKKYALKGEPGRDGSFTQKAYKTYASMIADKENIPANTSVLVNNDPDKNKNAYYTYDGKLFTKSDFDPQGILSTVDVKLNKAIESASEYFESQVFDTITSVINNGNTLFTKEILKTKTEVVASANKAVSDVLLKTTQTVENAIRDVAIDANLVTDALTTILPITDMPTARTQLDKNRESISVLDFFTQAELAEYLPTVGVSNSYFDAYRPLQEFFDYISANDVGTAYCNGNFGTSQGIVIGGADGCKTKYVNGNFRLTAMNKLPTIIDDLLTFWTGTGFNWTGLIWVEGNTFNSLSYDRRKVLNGVRIGGKHSATHIKLPVVSARNGFKNWGVILDNLTTGSVIDKIRLNRSGSGYMVKGYISHEEATFTVTGAVSGSTTQRSVLTVDNYLDFTKIEGAKYVYIDETLYWLDPNAFDPIANTISIFPTLPAGVINGKLMYVYGGGFLNTGNDASVSNVGKIGVSTCAICASMEALYPPIISSLTTQENFMGLSIGASLSAGIVGGVISQQYFEGNIYDIVQNTKYLANLQILNTVAVDLSKCLAMGNPRGSDGDIPATYKLTIGLQTPTKFLTPVNISSSSVYTYDLFDNRVNDVLHVVGRAKKTINLSMSNTDNFRLYGDRHRTIFIYTSDEGVIPDVTINPPAGVKINNKDSIVISGYTAMVRVDICVFSGTRISAAVSGEFILPSATEKYTPTSLAPLEQKTQSIILVGANMGDSLAVSFNKPLLGTRLWGEVTETDLVTVYHRNDTADTVDVASGNLKVKVI